MLFARISLRFKVELILFPTPVLYELVILTFRRLLAFLNYFVRVVMPVFCANGILSSTVLMRTLAPGVHGLIVSSIMSNICMLSSLDSGYSATETIEAALSFSLAFSRS